MLTNKTDIVFTLWAVSQSAPEETRRRFAFVRIENAELVRGQKVACRIEYQGYAKESLSKGEVIERALAMSSAAGRRCAACLVVSTPLPDQGKVVRFVGTLTPCEEHASGFNQMEMEMTAS